jgi:uncharacterized Fe-S cluster protein YjdI
MHHRQSEWAKKGSTTYAQSALPWDSNMLSYGQRRACSTEIPTGALASKNGGVFIHATQLIDQGQAEEEIVWLYGPLCGYKVVNGKHLVLVPWKPTWEPPDEYPRDEVDRVRTQWESQRWCKRRGRPARLLPYGQRREFSTKMLTGALASCKNGGAIAHAMQRIDQDQVEGEIVWPYGPLRGYKVVNGKPLVLVPWKPTWELPDEYPRDEVDRVKMKWELETRA